ncbi:MAG: hypothetical protein ABR542_06210 [Desulfonatronovibrio sp.]|nr:hypothetical protein [Desulfovibrionales bacterium]
MRRIFFLGFMLGMFILSSPAAAADLEGEWKNIEREGHHGALSGNPDHGTMPEGNHFASHIPWTLKITDQKDNGFHGQWCSSKMCENLVGVIRRDGSIIMVDEDTTFFATMYGDEMELCSTEPGKDFRVAACNILKKK